MSKDKPNNSHTESPSTQPQFQRRHVLQASGVAITGIAGINHTTQPAAAAGATATGPTVYVGANEGGDFDDGALYAVDAATGTQRWVFDEPSKPVQSGPTVVDGVVYFTDNANTVYAVDAETGTENWRVTALESSNTHSPTVVDGTVYVTAQSGVYGIDATTGEITWESATETTCDYAPTVVNGRVYAEGARIYAFDADTGEELWTFERDVTSTTAAPTVANGTVYTGGDRDGDNTLYAVDAETGTEAWRFETNGGSDVIAPTVRDNTVYVGTIRRLGERDWEGTLHAIDTETQDERWRYESEETHIASAPTVDDTQVYFSAGKLIAATAETGTEQWQARDPVGRSAPTVGDGIVFAGSDDTSLYAVEAATGETVWTFDEPSSYVVSPPTVVQNPADGHSGGSRVRLRTLGHHDKSPKQISIDIPDDPLEKYRNDNGEVTDTGLLEAISDWRDGTLNDSDLLSLISEWREAGGELKRIAPQLMTK